MLNRIGRLHGFFENRHRNFSGSDKLNPLRPVVTSFICIHPFTLPVVLLLLILLILSCSESYTPRPRGYYRIDFPVRNYQLFDTAFPFAFQFPVYASITPDTSRLAEPYWININYPGFHATLHMSYKPVHGNLARLLDDAHTLVNKHIPKANAITQREYADPERHVFGLIYNIRGADAASAVQFYLTDSTQHFVRGALYFNMVPNNDSLAPVIDFLSVDLEHMINTFRWKNQSRYDRNH
jgi:gliding motility-associated lipoprotein GldD